MLDFGEQAEQGSEIAKGSVWNGVGTLVDTQFLTQASGQDEDGEEGEPEDGGRRWARERRKRVGQRTAPPGGASVGECSCAEAGEPRVERNSNWVLELV